MVIGWDAVIRQYERLLAQNADMEPGRRPDRALQALIDNALAMLYGFLVKTLCFKQEWATSEKG